MGIIGPNAKVRVDGKGDHDLATIEYTKTKEKTPFTPLGMARPDRYTSGEWNGTWSGEVQSKADGSFAIDWDDLVDNDKEIPLVFEVSGRTERLVGCSVDEVGGTVDKTDGSYKRSISGKMRDHNHE